LLDYQENQKTVDCEKTATMADSSAAEDEKREAFLKDVYEFMEKRGYDKLQITGPNTKSI